MDVKERLPITHVAIRFMDRIFSLPKPNRHHDVIRMIAEQTGVKTVDAGEEDQGFLDSSGRYLNRKQALLNALIHKQVLDENNVRCKMLFSEDLW